MTPETKNLNERTPKENFIPNSNVGKEFKAWLLEPIKAYAAKTGNKKQLEFLKTLK
jgi:hypothetical protein